VTLADAKRADPDVLSTGSESLDAILGGGLPKGSVTVVAGSPGSGKTVLALELVFAQARRGGRILYVATLSEPSLKLLHYMQRFTFFDAELADRAIDFIDVGEQLLTDPNDALRAITERVSQREPAVVVIDSFNTIHELLPRGGAEARAFVYRLSVSLAAMGATSLLLGAYAESDVTQLPEFAVADGIIHVGSTRRELAMTRELEVLKLRGRGYFTGAHSFEITADGLAVYPRVRAPEAVSSEVPLERVPTGLAGLDDLLTGGLPGRSTTLVQGSTGTGKTLLSLAFLLEGARRGETGIHFGLDETPAQLTQLAGTIGWDLSALEDRGLLRLRYASPVELSTDRYLHEVREAVRRTGARRVVLDSLSTMEESVPSRRRFRELVYSIAKHMRGADATFLMTVEIAETFGVTQLTGHAVSSIADNVILLRYVELGGELRKAISVLKARGVAHKTELRSFRVIEGGPEVGVAFDQLRGVLTGLPVPVSEGGPRA
jgi:circadian clock protein KaiC